jgi:2-oxoglutarate dehydrogenase E1 component
MFLSRFAKKKTASAMLKAQSFFRYSQTFNMHKASSLYTDENFATGSNSVYFDQMYEQWKTDPNSVHASFNAYFSNVEQDKSVAYQAPPTLGQKSGDVDTNAIVQ